MNLLRPLGLPKESAVIAAGEFFRSRFIFSRCRLIPKVAVTRRPLFPTALLFHGMTSTETEQFTFGPYKINPSEVFYFTKLSYALVNLRPLLPGHVLVCPRREVKRFVDLTADETTDLWLVAKEVGGKLECHHKASSLTFAIQILSITTKNAIINSHSFPGMIISLKTSSSRITNGPTIFLDTQATSFPDLPNILQLLFSKQPCIQ